MALVEYEYINNESLLSTIRPQREIVFSEYVRSLAGLASSLTLKNANEHVVFMIGKHATYTNIDDTLPGSPPGILQTPRKWIQHFARLAASITQKFKKQNVMVYNVNSPSYDNIGLDGQLPLPPATRSKRELGTFFYILLGLTITLAVAMVFLWSYIIFLSVHNLTM